LIELFGFHTADSFNLKALLYIFDAFTSHITNNLTKSSSIAIVTIPS